MANVERLEQLKRVVRDAPDDLFDMHDVAVYKPCGTARCAWGWAQVDPWFQSNTDIEDIAPWCEEGSLELFDIPSRDFDNIFAAKICSDDPQVPKQEVIDNIDRLLVGQPTVRYPACGAGGHELPDDDDLDDDDLEDDDLDDDDA